MADPSPPKSPADTPGWGSSTAGERLDPAQARGVLIILAAMALMVTYVETMVVPAVVRFHTFFNQPQGQFSTVAWILSAYLLVGVASTPIVGKLGDIHGKKKILMAVIAVYAIAVSFAGFTPQIGDLLGMSRANEIYLLIAVRGVQGVGMSMFPLAFAMIGETFPPERVAGAQGAIAAMFAGGAALGLFGGAYLTQNFGWQVTYHTIIPFAFLVLVLAAFVLKESTHRLHVALDIPGSIFLAVGLGAFLTSLSEGPSWGWASTSAVSLGSVPFGTVDLYVISLVMTVAFLVWEPRIRNPIVDFARLKQRNIWISNVAGIIAGAAMFLMFVTTSFLAQLPVVGLGYTVLQYGFLSLPIAVAMMVFGPLLGRWTSSFGPRPVMIAGSLLIVIGGVSLAAFHATWYEMVLGMIPTQIGVIALFIAMTNIIVLSSRREETGIQTGMNATFRTLGQSLGPVLATSIIASFTEQLAVGLTPGGIPIYRTFPSDVGFRYVFLTAALLGAISVVLCFFLTNYRFRADGSRVDTGAPAPSPPSTPPTAAPVVGGTP
ncbi:MAG: MFS transporter [Thermoplasmata archaeon]|nr:MFS transporter [Thermoplasmata archaeon]